MDDVRQTGMTLVEVVVAMAIAGILIGISVMGFSRWQQNQTLATTTRAVALVSSGTTPANSTNNAAR